jgi:hypothetical protein
MNDFSYVEIDDGDPEGTHLWVSVNDEYFSMIELIDQFTIDERDRAYRVASRLSNLLKIPMKLKEGPFDTPRTISAADFPKRA